jgi:hypothetical protein
MDTTNVHERAEYGREVMKLAKQLETASGRLFKPVRGSDCGFEFVLASGWNDGRGAYDHFGHIDDLDELRREVKFVVDADGPEQGSVDEAPADEQVTIPLSTFDDVTLRTERVSALLRAVFKELENNSPFADATVLLLSAKDLVAEVDELLRQATRGA